MKKKKIGEYIQRDKINRQAAIDIFFWMTFQTQFECQ